MARKIKILKAGVSSALWAIGTSLYAQTTNVESALSVVKSQLKGSVTTIIDITMIVLVVVLVILLVPVAGKHTKGGAEGKDSILAWVGGLLFVLIALGVVRSLI